MYSEKQCEMATKRDILDWSLRLWKGVLFEAVREKKAHTPVEDNYSTIEQLKRKVMIDLTDKPPSEIEENNFCCPACIYSKEIKRAPSAQYNLECPINWAREVNERAFSVKCYVTDVSYPRIVWIFNPNMWDVDYSNENLDLIKELKTLIKTIEMSYRFLPENLKTIYLGA